MRSIDPDSGPSVGKKNSELPVYLSILGKAASSYTCLPFAASRTLGRLIFIKKRPINCRKTTISRCDEYEPMGKFAGMEMNGKMPDFGIS